MEELGDEDKTTMQTVPERSRNFIQAILCSGELHRRCRKKYVPLKETVRALRPIVEGEMDQYPEAAFFNVGTIDEAIEKAKTLGAEEGR